MIMREMKKTLLTTLTIFALLTSLLVGMQAVEVAKANFYMPPANTVWNVQYPLNSTYDTNYITLNFTLETNLGLLYFYSIDGQERIEINTTTLSKVPLPEYSPFIDGSLWNRRTEEGTTELPYLSKGIHELAIYQIYPLSKDNPENGNVVSKALAIFNVTSNLPIEVPVPTTNPTTSSQPLNPSIVPSPSPTQQPTPSPTLSAPHVLGDPAVDYTPTYIMLGILAITIALGAVAYFYFRKK
jgi:hypothetical protein